jgi:hypothetical protein
VPKKYLNLVDRSDQLDKDVEDIFEGIEDIMYGLKHLGDGL